MNDAETIDVCICTFRRPSLALTLSSIARQTLPVNWRIRVIVADNDETPSAQFLAMETARTLQLDLTYIHAPARNISIARNACLDAVTSRLCAFLDDDEIAPDGWLAGMLEALEDAQSDIAFGPVRALYGADAPRWLVKSDLHSFKAVVLADGTVRTGYTSNCIMKSAAIGSLRFDLDLGRSGGEDTEFFFRLYRAGVRLSAANSNVEEPVAPARANLGWLLKRSFRSGQTHARLLKRDGKASAQAALTAMLKAGACAGLALISLPSPPRAARQVVRAALHVGVVARLIGLRDLQIYQGSKP